MEGSGPTTMLTRGLAVLSALLEVGEARADELATLSGLPLSTTYRYLKALRELDFVSEEDGHYRAGEALVRAPLGRERFRPLARIADPVMRRLTQLTGETVTLNVRLDTNRALCVHQTVSPQPGHTAFRIGQTLPLHAGAGERVLLAFAPAEVIEAALNSELERFTDNTPDRETLALKLRSTRSSWITTSRAEYVAGAIALAVPVARGDRVVCSLTASGPSERCDAAWQAHTKPYLREAGRALSRVLDEAGWDPMG